MPIKYYNTQLLRRPFVTNALTTGFLFGAGDGLAQLAFSTDEPYDYARTVRAVIYGSVVFSPIGDRWYKTLARVRFPWKTANVGANRVLDTGFRVAFDQLCFAPLGIPLYYTVMSVLEQQPWGSIRVKLHEKWWTTLKTNWAVWPVFQMFNFYLVPVHYRLLSVNVISILWNCYMSYMNSDKTTSV